ncbi:uncharacterized protein VTP21DRAFT_11469 [Calcarisporiella thermophila]|uniref:uncharacterized protein n=1 Tax=Calcarisporiella thermophila TaxID=911321 RepID=UPI00374487C4
MGIVKSIPSDFDACDRISPAMQEEPKLRVKSRPLLKAVRRRSSNTSEDTEYSEDERFGDQLMELGGIKYIIPQDEEEFDRLRLRHYMFRNMFQSNFSAPIKEQLEKGIQVLDAGCGPGTWVVEMATEYRNSTFTGFEVSSIISQTSTHGLLPPNCSFRQISLSGPLPFADNTFDYIHMRILGMVLSTERWMWMLSELKRILKPGGYLEWLEHDLELKRRGPTSAFLNDQVMSCVQEFDIDPTIGRKIVAFVQKAGFRSVEGDGYYLSLPIGRWGGRCGEMARWDFEKVLRATRRITQGDAYTDKEIDMLMEECMREFDEYKTFYNIHVCVAQNAEDKPLEASLSDSGLEEKKRLEKLEHLGNVDKKFKRHAKKRVTSLLRKTSKENPF